jgi:hypothetical protein
MLVQNFGTMPIVERASVLVTHVDADAMCSVLEKPRRQETEQLRRDVRSSICRRHVDPLELAIAAVSSRQVTGDVPHHQRILDSDPHGSRGKGELGMMLASQVASHAILGRPARLVRPPKLCEVPHVGELRTSERDGWGKGHQSSREIDASIEGWRRPRDSYCNT